MAVLLIGSTGSGKSSLGNFLCDPRFMNTTYFKVGTSNRPETVNCQSVDVPVTYHLTSQGVKKENKVKCTLTLIDTPCINDGMKNDLERMIHLVGTLESKKSFKACILVVRFEAKIDQQYRDTIKYYATLLPSLFSQNCLIVMTNYRTDTVSKKVRKEVGRDYDDIVRNTKEEIEKLTNTYMRKPFVIDSVPCETEEHNKAIRDEILSCIFSLKDVGMTEFRVPKTRIMLSEDREEIKGYEVEIKGYSEMLERVDQVAKESLDKLKHKEKSIIDIKDEIKKEEDELKEIDIDSLSIINAHPLSSPWPIDLPWKLFKQNKAEFDLTSEFDIDEIEKSTNGRWKMFIQEGKRVHGVVKRNRMRSLTAKITLKTKTRNKHAERIQELKKDIVELKCELQHAEVAKEECSEKCEEKEKEKSDLEKRIYELRQRKENLSSDTMTLEQAREKMKNSTSQ